MEDCTLAPMRPIGTGLRVNIPQTVSRRRCIKWNSKLQSVDIPESLYFMSSDINHLLNFSLINDNARVCQMFYACRSEFSFNELAVRCKSGTYLYKYPLNKFGLEDQISVKFHRNISCIGTENYNAFYLIHWRGDQRD